MFEVYCRDCAENFAIKQRHDIMYMQGSPKAVGGAACHLWLLNEDDSERAGCCIPAVHRC